MHIPDRQINDGRKAAFPLGNRPADGSRRALALRLTPILAIAAGALSMWPTGSSERIAADGVEVRTAEVGEVARPAPGATSLATTVLAPPITAGGIEEPRSLLIPGGPDEPGPEDPVGGDEVTAAAAPATTPSPNGRAGEGTEPPATAGDSASTVGRATGPPTVPTTQPTTGEPPTTAGRTSPSAELTTAPTTARAVTTASAAPASTTRRSATTRRTTTTTTQPTSSAAPTTIATRRTTTTTTGPTTRPTTSTTTTTTRPTTTTTTRPTTTTTTRPTTTTSRPTTTTTRQTTTTTTRQTTTTTTRPTTTTAPPTTAGGSCPSGARFERVMRDDFNGSAVAGHWEQYNGPGNAGYGRRSSSAISVRDGKLVITGQMQDGNLVSGGMSHRYHQTYGKYRFRVRTDNDPSRSLSGVVLTWPQSGVHPRDGENNMYETLVQTADRNPFFSFIHEPYGTVHDQVMFQHDADGSQFQTMTMEWTPDRLVVTREGPGGSRYQEDHVIVENGDDLIPDVPHRLAIQLDAWSHSMSGTVEMELDWVEVYRYCG